MKRAMSAAVALSEPSGGVSSNMNGIGRGGTGPES
jgi:hypothetical protein